MSDSRRHRFPFHIAGVFLLLTATLTASRITSYRRSGQLAAPLETIPLQLQGFTGTPGPALQSNVLKELKATHYLTRRYRKGDLGADLFIAFYAQQRAGESMHSPKHCLPGSGWEIWDYDTVQIPVGSRSFTVNKYSISHEGERRLVFYWYQSKERIFASEYWGKLLLARDALLQSSTAAAIVRVTVPDRAGSLQEASVITAEMILQMERCFGGRQSLD
jgi:EpsI family protein